uniref:ORF3 n=1 Tax=Torque teno Leptonychotes weddellii virus-1 TaxID=2012676 RepID=A0A1Z2RVT7_9VIRU|nr:ORF3 [Torque teno Leptonychotes weddellii virus 1]ASA48699.1 ORF3 [Torque teno Leptonychotes weddellii virus 1]
MSSFRETSSQTESSEKELMKDLVDLIDLAGGPAWRDISPIRDPQRESDSESLLESESESELDTSSDFYWEDEENPGGEGPPLIPPQ